MQPGFSRLWVEPESVFLIQLTGWSKWPVHVTRNYMIYIYRSWLLYIKWPGHQRLVPIMGPCISALITNSGPPSNASLFALDLQSSWCISLQYHCNRNLVRRSKMKTLLLVNSFVSTFWSQVNMIKFLQSKYWNHSLQPPFSLSFWTKTFHLSLYFCETASLHLTKPLAKINYHISPFYIYLSVIICHPYITILYYVLILIHGADFLYHQVLLISFNLYI